MRIRGRLDKLEELLGMDRCRTCGPAGPYTVISFPGGLDNGKPVNIRGEPFPERCPVCRRELFDPLRALKVVGADMALI